MRTRFLNIFLAFNFISLATNFLLNAENIANDVSLILVKQNNKHNNLLNAPCNLELILPEDDELLKLVVKSDSEYEFSSLILSTDNSKVEQPYVLKKNEKKMLENDHDSANKNIVYEWSLQISQLPKTFLYYAFEKQDKIKIDLILKKQNDLLKRQNIVNIDLKKDDEFAVDFKKIKNLNKGIFSDFQAKPVIRHIFNGENKQAPEELAVFFSFAILLAGFITIMLCLKQIAESPVKVVTLKKKCGTLSYISMFLIGIVASEYSFTQYFLNNLSIFGLLKYSLPSLLFTILSGIKMSKRLF